MSLPGEMPATCPVCGVVGSYESAPVLWPELIDAWGLSPAEVEVLDPRDATRCTACHSQLRTMNLALAVTRAVGFAGPFVKLPRRKPLLRLLELNECPPLREMSRRRRFPRKVKGDFPTVDMQALPYADESFDVIMHGDTLEHVPDPLQGLRECRRVLKQGGALCYTVPVVVGRATRNRDGLPDSFHGTSDDPAYLVHTEYGDDVWRHPYEAGFSHVEIVALRYPSSFALICRR